LCNQLYILPHILLYFSTDLHYLVIIEQLYIPINCSTHCVDRLGVVITGYSTVSAFVTCGISTVLTRYNLSCLKVGEGGRWGGVIVGNGRGV
jgi:hypothetical protein